MKPFFIFSIVSCFSVTCLAQKIWKAASPDNGLQIVMTEKGGSLTYQVFSGRDEIIKPSGLAYRAATSIFPKDCHSSVRLLKK
jgi:hypothetical protein